MKENIKRSPTREKLIVNQETDEDLILNISLRPSKLTDFVGQKDAVENLKVSLTAAQKRNEPMEHTLLSGPPGLGKTSLAHIIANEMNTKITATSGPAIERAGDLIGILTNLGEGDILFIDEIHRLSKTVEEFIYPAMENFEIDFVIDKGPYAKTIKFNLKRFTLIGATTRAGLLTAPLRSRFGIFYYLDFYETADLVKIITRSAKIQSISATLNEEPDTIVDIVEPFLLKAGLLKRTPRGRELTAKAYEHMGLVHNTEEKQKEMF